MPATTPTAPIDSGRGPLAVLDAAAGPVPTLPAGFALFGLAFSRVGDALLLSTADGRFIRIEGFFATSPYPDLVDASGGFLSGDLAAARAMAGGELTEEELEAIAGLETAAGPGEADDAFDVGMLTVTLGFAPLADLPPIAVAPLGPFAVDTAAGAGPVDGRNPVETPQPPTVPASDPPPTRINPLDASDFSNLPGVTFASLVPVAGDEPALFYDAHAPRHLERDVGPGGVRQFRPTDPDHMLVMAAGSIAGPGQEGSAAGSHAADVIAFIDPTGTADFGPGTGATDGSAIRARIDLPKGQMLLADMLFDPRNGEVENDFAFVAVNGEVFRLADVAETTGGASGWRTVAIQNPTDGIRTIAFGVMNAEDGDEDPYLAIDNIRAHATGLAGDRGDRVNIGPFEYQVIWAVGSTGSDTLVSLLAPPLLAVDDTAFAVEDQVFESAVGALLDNDLAPLEGDGGDESVPLRVAAVDGVETAVGQQIVLGPSSGAPGSLLTVFADGTFRFDPAGTFDALMGGETGTVRFDYTVAAATGAFDTGSVVVHVNGVGGPGDQAPLVPRTVTLDGDAWSHLGGVTWEALLPAAETPPVIFYQVAAPVHLERDFVDGALRRFLPTDPGGMLLTAAGSMAAFGFEGDVAGATAVDVLTFADPDGTARFGTGTEPVDGSVVRGVVDVAPGTTLLFDMLFDPRNGLPEDDFAFLVVDGDLFRLADATGSSGGVTGWQTVAVQNLSDGISRVAFGVINVGSAANDPYLAVDNMRTRPDPLVEVPGQRAGIDGKPMQVVELAAGSADPATHVRTLVPLPTAADDAYAVMETGRIDTAVDASRTGLLANDAPPAPSFVTLDGVAAALPLSVIAVDGRPDAVGTPLPLVRSSGARGGEVTVAADGTFVFDPLGDFADLDAGETETVVFAYMAATTGGGSDIATATITIAGEGGSRSRLLADFEAGVLPGLERGDVAIVGAVRDGDFHAEPAHGASLLRLEADGPAREAIRAFIGQDTINPLIDLIDNSLPVRGSAFRLEAALEAGDTISFFWWFDSAESSGATGAALDDFALFRAGDDVHRFAGARMQTALTGVPEGHLAAYWTRWTVPDTAEYGLSWSVFDDAIDLRPSTLLIDLVEVNAPVPEGYTIVPEYSTDPFATFAPPASA